MSDDEKKSSGDNKEEWSSRHVRLKFQMITAALVAFACATYGIKDVDVLGIINLEEQPSPLVLTFGFYGFAIFSMFGFLSRTMFERKNFAKLHAAYALEFSKIDTQLRLACDESDKLDKKTVDSVFSKLPDEHEIVKPDTKTTLRLDAAINLLSLHVQRLKSLHAKVIASTNSLKSSDFKFGSTQRFKAVFFADIVQTITDVEILEKRLEEIKGVNYVNPKISQHNAKSALIRMYESNDNLKVSFSKSLVSAKDVSKEINRVNRWWYIENWILSVWVPMLITASLLLSGLIVRSQKCFLGHISKPSICEFII